MTDRLTRPLKIFSVTLLSGHHVPLPTSRWWAKRESLVAAIAITGLACATTAAVPALAERSTFLLAFAAVVISGLLGGSRAAAASLGLGAVYTYALLPRAHVIVLMRTDDMLRVGAFLAISLLVTVFYASLEDAATRLREAEERWRVVVESAPVLITGADEQGRIALFNQACERLTGYGRDEVLGRQFVSTLVPEGWQDAVVQRFAREPAHVLAQPHRNPWRTRNGDRLIEWRCFHLESAGGHRLVLGVGQDVTEQQAADDRIREALERETAARRDSEAATETRDRFIAVLAHEVRTPLNALIGWARMLSLQASDERMRKGVEAIERSGQHLVRLTEDLFNFSRLSSGKLTIERQQVPLERTLSATIAAVEPAARRKGISIRSRIEDETISADPDRLQQIVNNLLTNALKFTPEGGEVAVEASVSDGILKVSVADSGIGIPADALEHVFQPFWQVSTGQAGDGLGLGLALAKQIAELHGGSISVESTEGRGTTFHVRIPVATAAEDALAG